MNLGTFTKVKKLTHFYVEDCIVTVTNEWIISKIMIWDDRLCDGYLIAGLEWNLLDMYQVVKILGCKIMPGKRYLLSMIFIDRLMKTRTVNIEFFPDGHDLAIDPDINVECRGSYLHIWPKNLLDFHKWSDIHRMQMLIEYRKLWKVFASDKYSCLTKDVRTLLLNTAFWIVLWDLVHIQQKRNTLSSIQGTSCISGKIWE